MEPTDNQRLMVETFQCPGCTAGFNTRDACFRFVEEGENGFHCAGQTSGTFMSGVGRIALGLPKGFCRENRAERNNPNDIGKIRLFEGPTYGYDLFNVPVWAAEQSHPLVGRTGEETEQPAEPFTFIRVFQPRMDATWVHVIQGSHLGAITPTPINVSDFIGEMD